MEPKARERLVISALAGILISLADIVGRDPGPELVEGVFPAEDVPGGNGDMGRMREFRRWPRSAFETVDEIRHLFSRNRHIGMLAYES
ncbi:MAG: hypothetical protein EBY17_23275 [Acidobacteriia bacterium]|nr:hypothetical protein [Terriglobia bacterium]